MKAYLSFILFVAIQVMTSCGNKTEQKENDSEQREEEHLKSARSTAIDLSLDMNRILKELAEISSKTMLVRQSVENGTAQMRSVDKICMQIQGFKARMEELERQNLHNEELAQCVHNLRIVIIEKEKAIVSLKKVVANQKALLHQKEQVILNQDSIITNNKGELIQTKEELKKAISEQAILLFRAASDLEMLATDVPDVSKKKNKKKIEQYQKKLLQKSFFYYRNAYMYGYIPAKNGMERLNRKLGEI